MGASVSFACLRASVTAAIAWTSSDAFTVWGAGGGFTPIGRSSHPSSRWSLRSHLRAVFSLALSHPELAGQGIHPLVIEHEPLQVGPAYFVDIGHWS